MSRAMSCAVSCALACRAEHEGRKGGTVDPKERPPRDGELRHARRCIALQRPLQWPRCLSHFFHASSMSQSQGGGSGVCTCVQWSGRWAVRRRPRDGDEGGSCSARAVHAVLCCPTPRLGLSRLSRLVVLLHFGEIVKLDKVGWGRRCHALVLSCPVRWSWIMGQTEKGDV